MSNLSFKIFTVFIVFSLLLVGCSTGSSSVTEQPTAPANPAVILVTTTSTRDTGLLDVLLPMFESRTGYTVKMVAVETDEALTMGEQGSADVLLLHAPATEKEFMTNGYGSERILVMHNDFVIIGPADDPAGIKGAAKAADAFAKIANANAVFVSRADGSEIHKIELAIWQDAGITPEGDWYLQTGQSMVATLGVASEKSGYTLTDRATFLAQQSNLKLEILSEGDTVLMNIYHVIVVNPEKWPNINLAGAQAFARFLVTDDAQDVIAKFDVDTYGQPLFFPDADKTDAELGLD
jgi:tungstate transport system substrate-binding protein